MPTVTDDVASHGVPERLTVAEQLARLSGRYVEEGDVRRAQLASWAADVYVLEELLWENGLAEAPDPVAQLAAVGESVAAALEALAEGVSGDVMPRAVVEAARRAMVSTFDESVHEVLLEQLPSLDHLDACAPASASGSASTSASTSASSSASADRPDSPAVERLGGRTAEELVAELRQAATDCVLAGEVLDAAGEYTAAERMSHQADVATFEAYLVATAIHAGDHRLASVDLRWELARQLTPEDWAADERDRSPFATLRRELIALVGSAEMETLWRAFETADGA
jgi:hypothetical protein